MHGLLRRLHLAHPTFRATLTNRFPRRPDTTASTFPCFFANVVDVKMYTIRRPFPCASLLTCPHASKRNNDSCTFRLATVDSRANSRNPILAVLPW